MNRFLLLIILAGASLVAPAQDNGQAALRKKLMEFMPDSERVNNLNLLSRSYFNDNPDSSVIIAMSSRDLAERIGYRPGQALALKNMGIGYYWQGKTFTGSDPLTAADRNILVDPDASAATFAAEIAKLKTLYQSKLVITPLDQAMDRDGTTPVNILFRPNYYVSGLTGTILSNNPWLQQTKGWLDYNGAPGTFDIKQ